jgi:peptidoglycan/LPS O-acetylase OafA/YrhL
VSVRWLPELPAFGPRPGTSSVRLHELDGLRGWAALSVVAYHLFWEVFAALAPGFHNIATGFLLDGQLAVSVFFVLSGEALSATYFAGKGDVAIYRLAIKRYPRLVIPILAVCLIVYVICHAGLAFNGPAGDVIGRPDWLGSWLKNPPSISDVLVYSFATVFVINDGDTAVNPFLATMMLELKVSFFVLFLLLAFKHLSNPRLVLIAVFTALILLPSTRHVGCFFAGVILADIRWSGGFAAAQKSSLNWITWAPQFMPTAVRLVSSRLRCRCGSAGFRFRCSWSSSRSLSRSLRGVSSTLTPMET